MMADVQKKEYREILNDWKAAARATEQNEEVAQKITRAADKLLDLSGNQQKSSSLDLRFLGLPNLPNVFSYLNTLGVKELLLNDRSLTQLNGINELKSLEK